MSGSQFMPGIKNALDWEYFDENTIATGAVSSSFFDNTAAKTEQQTNFPTNGQLPAGQRFRCDAVSVWILPNNAAVFLTVRDVVEVQIARLDFKLNNVNQFESHPGRLPAGAGVQVDVSAAANVVQNGWSCIFNKRWFKRPIWVDHARLQILIRFLPAVTLATSAIVRVYMEGQLSRNPS